VGLNKIDEQRIRARNEKILELANKGWKQKSIARMFKMKLSAVSMVIWRARKRKEQELAEEK